MSTRDRLDARAAEAEDAPPLERMSERALTLVALGEAANAVQAAGAALSAVAALLLRAPPTAAAPKRPREREVHTLG